MAESIMDYYISQFELYFPKVAEDVVEYRAHDKFSFDAIMDDGQVIRYDALKQAWDYVRAINEENPDEWKSAFGQKLERKMRICKISRQQLSERTGLSVMSISKYINGITIPSAHNLVMIARALNCSVEDLTDFS